MELEEDRLRKLLAGGLAELGDDPDALLPAVDRLVRLALLVARWTRRVDLTGHRGAEDVVRHLILEALALARAVGPFATLVDLGSGAGFPGLPMAIRYLDRQFTLVEARERRHHFQRTAIRELELRNVRALRGRIEELTPEPHEVAVAQAIGAPGLAVRWMLAWARPGGRIVLPAGRQAPPIGDAAPQVSWTQVEYLVPLGGPQRIALIGRIPAI